LELIAITDTREKRPVQFKKMPTVVRGLKTGDYSVILKTQNEEFSLEDYVCVERKGSLDEFVSCVGGERERFDREIMRLKEIPVKAIVVATTFEEIIAGNWQPRVSINAVLGSFIGWQCHGVPIILAGHRCNEFIEWFLTIAAKRKIKEMTSARHDKKD
jgi:hypothetical protein